MSNLDDTMRSDLSALADLSNRSLPEFAELSAQLIAPRGAYRDHQPGAEARRRSLLERRLQELALLPMAYERVFVHRVSRAAAGAVLFMSAWFLVLASTDDSTRSLVHIIVGFPTAPLVASLLVGAALVSYVVAGSFAERHYERHMRGRLRPGADALVDIEELEGLAATDEAQRLIDRVDGASVALALAGGVAAGLLLGMMIFFSDPGFSAIALVREGAGALVPSITAGTVSAILVARSCARDRRRIGGSGLVRLFESWVALALAAGLTAVAVWYAARTALGLHILGVAPGEQSKVLLAGLGAAALVALLTWALLWLRRSEERKLGLRSR